MAIVYGSGKLTHYLLNRFVWGGQEGFTEDNNTASKQLRELKGEGAGTEPREQVKILTTKDLQNTAFFGKGRNYFI